MPNRVSIVDILDFRVRNLAPLPEKSLGDFPLTSGYCRYPLSAIEDFTYTTEQCLPLALPDML